MKCALWFVTLLIALSIYGSTNAQTKKQVVTLKSLNCNGYDCYFEFTDPQTKKPIKLDYHSFDQKFSQNWKPAHDEVLELNGEQEGTDRLLGKKYAITLVFRVDVTEEWDEEKEDYIVKKGKVKKWFVTSLKRLT